ncbi:MAG: hypothetical protein LBT79_03225, partial [Elusimicrobiota bacterium]|nr:hypothetical protein [Elusimicrobiota bacterium]
MRLTTAQITKIVSGELIGDASKIIKGVNGLDKANEDEISFLSNMKYLSQAINAKAGALFIPANMDISQFQNKNIIKVSNPQYAYAMMLGIIDKERISYYKPQISNKAYISDKAIIGKDIYIGSGVSIEDGAQIGD